MKHIRIAGVQDAQSITELRVREFSRSNEFKLLEPEKLYWGESDNAQTVLGVWNGGGKIVATMGMMRVTDAGQAASVLKFNLPVPVPYPGLVLNTAATASDFRRRGFNQLLRYYCIRFAKATAARSLMSSVFQNAPRIRFMKNLGYVCHELTESWQTKLLPNCTRILCILEADRFDAALDLIESAIPGLIEEYPWQGDSLAAD